MDSVISTLLVTLQIQQLQTIRRPPRGVRFIGSKVGFPIRKFLDQSLFAAPHDLSQRTTSFIASQHQGIHRIPLSHLIDLIIHAHPSAGSNVFPVRTTFYHPDTRSRHAITHKSQARARPPGIEETPGFKTSLLQLHPQDCLPWAEAKGQSAMSAVKHDNHSIRIKASCNEAEAASQTPQSRTCHSEERQPDRVSLHDVKSRSMRSRELHRAPAIPKDFAAEPNLSAPRPFRGSAS